MKKFLWTIVISTSILLGVYIAYRMIGGDTIRSYMETSKVYITGNLHGKLGIDRLSKDNFIEQKELSANDNLIILGDFGLIWDNNIEDEMILDELAKKRYNILFVDGAHENFTLLNNYEEVELYGGRAHKIRDNIYHLIRGEVYVIGGKKYLVFGGGESEDKEYRVEGETYWQEEIPNEGDWDNLNNNLKKYNNYVDCVLTYTPPSSDLKLIGAECGVNLGSGNSINRSLEELSKNIKYKKWIHSYYHLDIEISRKHTSVYESFIKLK